MKKNLVAAIAAVTTLLLISSCRKDIDMQAASPVDHGDLALQKKKKQVTVSTISQLYTSVNDPDNVDADVYLSPGIYVLDAAQPNAGRLELQQGMTMRGQPGDPGAVVIDASALPSVSFAGPTASTGAVRMGRGVNRLEWLTVRGGALSSNPFAVVAVDLPSAEARAGFSHVVVQGNGSRIGIDLRNRLPEHTGRKIIADMEFTEITGLVSSFGFGLVLLNVNEATGASITLNMQHNYIHGNKIGILAGNNAIGRSMQNGSITITSHADRLEGNGVALDPSGGVNQGTTSFANNNTTVVRMYGTSIRYNNPSPMPPALMPVNGATPAGIYAAGGYNSVNGIAGYNRASNNTLDMEFHGCMIGENNGPDVYAYGAWCPPATLLAGSNNLLRLSLHGVSAQAVVEAIASVPAEPAGTNVINVNRN